MFNLVILTVLFSVQAQNDVVQNFRQAKKYATLIHQENPKTIYCSCQYFGKKIDLNSCGYKVQKNLRRAQRLEWEHVVPAHAFGQSFVEWREGAAGCMRHGKNFKGRKCAETNPQFSKMEADLYNLYPEIGELNGLRNNFSMASIPGPVGKFGTCSVKLEGRKFEPADTAKGVVARTYFYMEKSYPHHGIVSNKNQKLFETWNKMFPPADWECKRGERIKKIQHNANTILEEACKKRVS